MSTNDEECQTKARKTGGYAGVAIFFALWLLSSVGIAWSLVAGVVSAIILARLTCWATGCLPTPPKPMTAEEGAALRRPAPASAPAASPVIGAWARAAAAKPAEAPKAVPAPAPAPAAPAADAAPKGGRQKPRKG